MSSKLFGLFAFAVFAVLLVTGFGSAVTLANWNFEYSDLVVDSGTATLTLSDSRTATFPSGNAPSAVAAMSSTGWDIANRYVEISLSTVGYENLVLKFDEQRSTTGPTAFQVQYSADGTTFTNLGSTTSTITAFTANPMHTFDFSTVTTIDNNTNTKLRITVPTGSTASDSAGTLRVDNVVIEGTAVASEPSEIQSCTAAGNPGALNVKKIDFSNNGMQYKTFGQDDEWFPFEEVEVDIDLENEGDFDVANIEVEWGLYDTRDNQWVIELDKEDEFDIDESDEETITVTFQIDDNLDVDLDELSDGDHYRLYVVMTGEVDDNDAGTLDGLTTCAADFEPATIVVESDFPVLTNFNVPETVQCGATVELTADVWNIGDGDQDEVKVYLFNSELSLDEVVEVGDIDAFDNQPVSITFPVPGSASEKTYQLNFEVWDEDREVYQNDYDDDDSEFTVPLSVSGSCGGASDVTVTANVVSGGKAGQELVVKATVTNTGSSQAVYALSVVGSEAWASSYTLDQSSLVLGAGQAGEATVTFNVNRDAAGTQTFFLELASDGQIARQPVTVSLEESSGGFLGITGLAVSGNNWYLWGIGLLNLVLVIVIIVVAVKVARR